MRLLLVCVCVCVFLDLVPRDIVEKWLKHLRNEFPTVAFKASTQNQKQNLVSISWSYLYSIELNTQLHSPPCFIATL